MSMVVATVCVLIHYIQKNFWALRGHGKVSRAKPSNFKHLTGEAYSLTETREW